jgi:predicted Zn-ribbon and HTH transcriptional regulator
MEREFSIRESIYKALLRGPVTARDLSRIVGIREHDVAQHLEHLKRSLKHRGQVLVIEPPTCLDCGFAFPHRDRYTRPSGCPKCRGRRLGLPRFRVEDVSG